MTKDEIREYIKNYPAAEFERDRVDYYLHITDDGKVVPHVDMADATFIESLDAYDYGMTQEEFDNTHSVDPFYAHEEDGDPIFERIVDSLYEQAQEYLSGVQE